MDGKRLAEKVAVITGAGSGMGAAMAERFHAEGAKVVAFDISGAEQETADRLGADCVGVNGDASRSEDVRAALDRAVSDFGHLDILVNNAAIEGPMGSLVDTSVEDFDRLFAVNARGVFLGFKHGVPLMRQSGGGAILSIASAAGLIATPTLGAYSASKSACIMLARTAAKEYAKYGIRSNVICPGTIDTPMLSAAPTDISSGIKKLNPMGRLGQTEEIAAAAAFLVSDEASYITGAVLSVDGGIAA
jgi:NAD(P)-dependent dehydrogenase (short-subunit alcohol dehydrogenase family)